MTPVGRIAQNNASLDALGHIWPRACCLIAMVAAWKLGRASTIQTINEVVVNVEGVSSAGTHLVYLERQGLARREPAPGPGLQWFYFPTDRAVRQVLGWAGTEKARAVA